MSEPEPEVFEQLRQAYKRAPVDDDGQPIADPLAHARAKLKLADLKRVIKRSRDDATYALELEDGTVIEIGSSADLMNPRKVEAAVADATGIAILYFGPKKFREVAACLLAVAELEETGASRDDVTRSWLAGFIEKAEGGFDWGVPVSSADLPRVGGTVDLSDPEKRALVVGVRDDERGHLVGHFDVFWDPARRLYLSLDRFEHFMRHVERVPTSRSDLTARLHRLKFERERVYAPRRGDGKTPRGRWFWRSPAGFRMEEES